MIGTLRHLKTNILRKQSRFLLVLVLSIFLSELPTLGFAKPQSIIKKEFYQLRHRCLQTMKDKNLLASRENVKRLSLECNRFWRRYPSTVYGIRVLYLSGMLWEGLYKYSKHVSDWNQSLRAYTKIVALYPNSWLADEALYRSGILYLKLGLNGVALSTFKRLLKKYPNSDLRSITKTRIYRISHGERTTSWREKSSAAVFRGFRYWSNKTYARLVMDFSNKLPFRFKIRRSVYETNLLFTFEDQFKSQNGKQILYGKGNVFFKKAALKKPKGSFPRIVVTFGASAQCRVFTLLSPFRIVIDAVFQEGRGKIYPQRPPKRKSKGFIICLDPGHGGKDPGATGPDGIKEKDVVLRIAKILRTKLVDKYGFKVIMTRNRDVYVPLEERVAFANSHGADLFISIHINASHNRRLQGITTFCLSNTSDKKSLRLAARENGVPLSKMSSVEKILNDMLFCEKYNESYQVAHIIHHELMNRVRDYNPSIRDLGVRFAPFYVLAGAKMPSILLELDFISNPHSEKRLVRYPYLNAITDGIADGILKTAKSVDLAQKFN